MDPQDAYDNHPTGDQQRNDCEDLIVHFLKDLGPRIVRSLRRRLRWNIIRDPWGAIDEAVVRLLRRSDLKELRPADVDRLFFAYCRVVASEFSRDSVKRSRHGERSLPIEKLERLAAASHVRSREGSPDVDDSTTGRHVQLLHAALNSLSERDRMILWDWACPIDPKESGGDLASELGISKKDLRVERHRARLRLKAAYLQLAQETDQAVRESDKMTGPERRKRVEDS
jgi:hypothetical protein